MTKRAPEEIYEEREKRIRDAIQSKESDRIPIALVALSLQPDKPGRGLRAPLNEAKPENVRVTVDSIKKYG